MRHLLGLRLRDIWVDGRANYCIGCCIVAAGVY